MVGLLAVSMFAPTNVVCRPKKTISIPIRPSTDRLSLFLSQPFSGATMNPNHLLCSTSRGMSISPRSCYDDVSSVNPISKFLEIKLKVREYELDQYGVVNNAVYSGYFQIANIELAKLVGLEDNEIQNIGGAATSKMSITFMSPLKSGDEFVMKSRITECSAVRFFVDHFIYKLPNYEPIVEAKAVLVLVDKNNRPARIPAHVKSKAKQLMGNQSSPMDLIMS